MKGLLTILTMLYLHSMYHPYGFPMINDRWDVDIKSNNGHEV